MSWNACRALARWPATRLPAGTSRAASSRRGKHHERSPRSRAARNAPRRLRGDPRMTARYRIHHTSSYNYDQAVTASFNEVRQTPAVALWQSPLESVLRVDQSSWHHRYVDYWGTQV